MDSCIKSNYDPEIETLDIKPKTLPPEVAWECYLFGYKPGTDDAGLIWSLHKGGQKVPNFFIRWMMRVCLGCTWVKK